MRVIASKALVDFAQVHRDASIPIQVCRRIVEAGSFGNFSELKRTLNTADKVGDHLVFDIAGNKYRLVAAVHFNRQMVFVRHVFTHKEYDLWKP